MPDDVKPDDQKPAETTLDPKALGDQISAQVAASVADALRNQPAAQTPVATDPTQPEDALAIVLEPYVTKATRGASLIAQMAADKADFYAVADPDELEERLAHKDEVEKRAIALASQGRALPREDIFKHLKGEKFNEFAEKAQVRKKKREDRARAEGEDHAGDGVPRVRGGGMPEMVTATAAYDLQEKGKLDEFLGGKEF